MARTENEIFEFYKNRLLRECHREENGVKCFRFNVIEYVCSFPEIDPYTMAAELKREGCKIIFDDSSISMKENKAKENKVEKLCNESE